MYAREREQRAERTGIIKTYVFLAHCQHELLGLLDSPVGLCRDGHTTTIFYLQPGTRLLLNFPNGGASCANLRNPWECVSKMMNTA